MKEFIFHKMERKRETMCTCSRGKKQQSRSEFGGFRHRGQKEISLVDMGGEGDDSDKADAKARRTATTTTKGSLFFSVQGGRG